MSWSAPTDSSPEGWISLYATGADVTQFLQGNWQNTGGATTGTFTLPAPAIPGTYEFWCLLNDGFTSVAKSNPVTVR